MGDSRDHGVPGSTAPAEDAWWDAVYGPEGRDATHRASTGTVDDWFATALGAIGASGASGANSASDADSGTDLPPTPPPRTAPDSLPPPPRVADPRVVAPRAGSTPLPDRDPEIDLDLYGDPALDAAVSRPTPRRAPSAATAALADLFGVERDEPAAPAADAAGWFAPPAPAAVHDAGATPEPAAGAGEPTTPPLPHAPAPPSSDPTETPDLRPDAPPAPSPAPHRADAPIDASTPEREGASAEALPGPALQSPEAWVPAPGVGPANEGVGAEAFPGPAPESREGLAPAPGLGPMGGDAPESVPLTGARGATSGGAGAEAFPESVPEARKGLAPAPGLGPVGGDAPESVPLTGAGGGVGTGAFPGPAPESREGLAPAPGLGPMGGSAPESVPPTAVAASGPLAGVPEGSAPARAAGAGNGEPSVSGAFPPSGGQVAAAPKERLGPPPVPTPTLPDGGALRWGRGRPSVVAGLPEPDALPEADPEDLGALVPDTVMELARHGSMTLRAASARGEDGRALGAPRGDRLVVARFGEGADGLLVAVIASGPGAGEAARLLAESVGRSRAGLLADLRQGAQEQLRYGLQRLTARAARVLGPEGAVHAVLAPLDPTNRLRAGFGTGPGSLLLLGDDAWYDAYAGRRLTTQQEAPPEITMAEQARFRFRAVVPESCDVLLLCTDGLAAPLRAEPAVAALLAEHWSQPHAPGGVDFLRQIQSRASGHSGDRTAVAIWED